MALAFSSQSAHLAPVARLFAAAALIGGLILGAAPGAAAQRSAAGFADQGSVVFTGEGYPSDIDPANNEQEYGDTVIRNIDDTLVRLAGTSLNSFEPELATSWSSNADKSVWTFHLRHGVAFHTGRCCMTSADVVYSLGRSVSAQLGGSYMLGRFITDPSRQIAALDPYTVQFRLGRPQPLFLAAAAQNYNALILDSRAVKAHEVKHDWGHAWVATHDAGTGPYMIQSLTVNQQVALARFPGYWGGWSGRHFSRVLITTVTDSTTRRELVERGQADITFDLTPQDYNALKSNSKVQVVAPYATQIVYIAMTPSGPLASPLARQALSYAFPYDALIKGIYGGYAKRSNGVIPSTILGYNSKGFQYTTDLMKAKALFRQAGVPQGTTLTYTYDPNFPNSQMGQILAAQLQQVGINLKLQQLDTGAFSTLFYGTAPASQRPNLLAYTWWPDYNDPYDMANTLIGGTQGPPNGNNGGLYRNKRVDALLARMENASPGTVGRLGVQLQDLSTRVDPACIWAAEPAQVTVLAGNLRGYIANPVDLRTFFFYTMYRG